jgi:hypothetical protein
VGDDRAEGLGLMATIKHRFVSMKADGPDTTQVKPSNWNDTHDVEIVAATGVVLGRDTSGAGPMQELPIAVTPAGDVSFPQSKGGTGIATGTTAQRPAPPVIGQIRFNTDTNQLEVYGAGGAASWSAVLVGAGVPPGATLGWYNAVAPAGWLLVDGSTVGDDVSGANHNSQAMVNLFAYLWNLDNSVCPVLPGGRGVSAAADWAAHKTIGMPNETGRVAVAPDAAGTVIPGATMLGALIGTKDHNHSVPVSGNTGPTSTGAWYGINNSGPAVPDHTHSFSVVATADTKSNVQPGIVKNVIIKY